MACFSKYTHYYPGLLLVAVLLPFSTAFTGKVLRRNLLAQRTCSHSIIHVPAMKASGAEVGVGQQCATFIVCLFVGFF